MNIPADMLALPWLVLGYGLFLPLLGLSLRGAPWQQFKQSASLHLFLGTCVALMLLWTLRAGVAPGLSFHVLGATFLTLVFGWRLAFLGLCIVLAGVTLAGQSGLETFAHNALLLGAVPVGLSEGVRQLAERFLPRHLFVYLFVSGFFNAALAVGAAALASAFFQYAAGVHALGYLAEHYLPYIVLLLFPEGFLTGVCLSYFVIYHPEWVASYREEIYLKG
jgi:uncharacterized membrane protein